MVDHPLPTLPTPRMLGNGQSDAAILHLLDEELTDEDGVCGSVSLTLVALFLLIAVPRSRINCRAIAPPLTLAVKNCVCFATRHGKSTLGVLILQDLAVRWGGHESLGGQP